MKKIGILACLFMAFSTVSVAEAGNNSGLAQGLLSGEMTDSSVILQARLTKGERQENGEIEGASGVARFEISRDPEFASRTEADWLSATAGYGFIVKKRVGGLHAATVYYYRLRYGPDEENMLVSEAAKFQTLGGAGISRHVTFTATTCLNYVKFHDGDFNKRGEMVKPPFTGPDKHLGFSSFAFIPFLEPEFVIYNGDIVYYDQAPPGEAHATSVEDMRFRWHRQLSQPRIVHTFSQAGSYFLKDDHDFRYNDADLTGNREPSTETGIRIFNEQAPIVDPQRENPVTYRTHRVSKELQMWFMEGRDYRSPNAMEDGPGKSIWGETQMAWVKETLLASDAKFKVLVVPSPMVGPDKASKTDNHTNLGGFRHEAGAFFAWMVENRISTDELFIITGDRHWQYHSIHPTGYQEFSSGSISYANAQRVIAPGDVKGTDPEALIRQPFASPLKNGGFLQIDVLPGDGKNEDEFKVRFYNEWGQMLYTFSTR